VTLVAFTARLKSCPFKAAFRRPLLEYLERAGAAFTRSRAQPSSDDDGCAVARAWNKRLVDTNVEPLRNRGLALLTLFVPPLGPTRGNHLSDTRREMSPQTRSSGAGMLRRWFSKLLSDAVL
jgi:hypothetical protein